MHLKLIIFIFSLSIGLSGAGASSELTIGGQVRGDEPMLHADRFGSGSVAVVSNGFLFIDNKFLPGPYRIQRVGQAIVVNGMLINNLFKDDIDETVKANSDWRSPMHGFKTNTLKEFADLQKALLVQDLEGGGIVFIAHGPSSRGKINRMPVAAKWMRTDLESAIEIVASAQPESNKLAALKALQLKGLLSDEEIKTFYEQSRVSTQLIQQVKLPRVKISEGISSTNKNSINMETDASTNQSGSEAFP